MPTTRLPFGWEGRSPTSEAIEMAGLISAELPANARLTVTPDVDGGAVLRWIHGACRVDFFCDNEGELTLLTVGADGSPRGIEFGAVSLFEGVSSLDHSSRKTATTPDCFVANQLSLFLLRRRSSCHSPIHRSPSL